MIRVTPRFGPFDAPVAFAYRGLPTGCSASFSPPDGTPGSNVMDIVFTVRTKGSSSSTAAGAASVSGPGAFLPPALGLLLAAAALFAGAGSRVLALSPRSRRLAVAAALAVLIAGGASCGAGGGGGHNTDGTPPGTYTIDVKAHSGTFSTTIPVTLVVR
ncbi:MAG TPA: hypothetical protein VLN41_00920 [Candidatus Bathyarchaeia archaeon]|nr:hypothetical protein [Candidatus Bathyarchaeia archaeon]